MSEKDNEFEIETIMERVAEQRVLTSEVLCTESRLKERKDSIERLKDEHTNEDTEESKAQGAIFEYILHLGGIREDVYNLLLTLQWKNISTASTLRPFLYYAASPEWIELAAEVQEKTESFFMNELVAAYKDGIPIEAVRKFIESSRTLFEMCQCRMQYIRHMEEKTERNPDGTAVPSAAEASILKDLIADLNKLISGNCSQRELSDSVTRSKKEELDDSVTRSEKEELNDSVTRSKKEELSDSVTRSEKEELDDSVTRSEKEELSDSVTRSEKEELDDIVTQSPKEELEDSVAQSGDKTNVDLEEVLPEAPPFPDGNEILDSRLLVADLEEKEKTAGKRISFFAELLKRHQKKMFAKLEEKERIGKLFEIMIGKQYGKRKILAIKKLMDSGMSREFIFSLLEKEMPEEELVDLCDTLVPEDYSQSITDSSALKKEKNSYHEEIVSEQDAMEQDEFVNEYDIAGM